MMQPPRGSAQPGAARLEDDEEKKKLLKELLREMAREKAEELEVQADRAGVHVLLCLGFVLAVVWWMPLWMYGWHQKMFATVGAKIVSVSTSAWRMKIGVKCGKNRLEDIACKYLEKAAGDYSMKEVMDYACLQQSDLARKFLFPMGTMLCDLMYREFMASLIPAICTLVVSVLYIIGIIYLWIYWRASHRKKFRTQAACCYSSAPMVGSIGIFGFLAMAPDISQLPVAMSGGPSSPVGLLTTQMNINGQPGLGSDVGQLDHGPAFFAALICLFWSLIVFLLTMCLLTRHPQEINEDEFTDGELMGEPVRIKGDPKHGEHPMHGGHGQSAPADSEWQEAPAEQQWDPAWQPQQQWGPAAAAGPHEQQEHWGSPQPEPQQQQQQQQQQWGPAAPPKPKFGGHHPKPGFGGHGPPLSQTPEGYGQVPPPVPQPQQPPMPPPQGWSSTNERLPGGSPYGS